MEAFTHRYYRTVLIGLKQHLIDGLREIVTASAQGSQDSKVKGDIKNRAVGHPVLKAHRVSEAIAGVDEKPALYA